MKTSLFCCFFFVFRIKNLLSDLAYLEIRLKQWMKIKNVKKIIPMMVAKLDDAKSFSLINFVRGKGNANVK